MPKNRLAQAQSPYLLQHQDNPVDWYAWGDEALQAAAAADKPIFLSIGYATCHWCHVMAHESFEDDEVAAAMNDAFINIKVDREERPDLDNLYMSVCQLVNGRCGWPLNVVLTPEGRPFFVATYLPKQSRFGRVGMLDLVPRLQMAWAEKRPEVERSAAEITASLKNMEGRQREEGRDETPAEVDLLHRAYQRLRNSFDDTWGGFGEAPKFPTPHTVLFVLRYAHRTGSAEALKMATLTLDRMRQGGLFDQLGFGFHRYSTDREWRLPHFEKMLYDQALLIMAYLEAFQATGEARFAQTAHEVIAYVLRDLSGPEGAFYSAEDADSEGREGAFYVWTVEEVRALLAPEDAALIEARYGLEQAGNFEDEATRARTGENILVRERSVSELAEENGVSEAQLREQLKRVQVTMLAHRGQRPRPLLDDKVLTDWNGLMIAALAQAGAVLETPAYTAAAQAAAAFILSTLRTSEGRLLHRYRGGQAGLPATADDYVFMGWGLLNLFETTQDPKHLADALALHETLATHFWDAEQGGYFFTPADGEALLVRQKSYFDGALPSANAIGLLNLVRLGRLTGNPDWEQAASAIFASVAGLVRQHPTAMVAILLGVDFVLGPTHEIVVAGDPGAADTQALLEGLRRTYRPRSVLLVRPDVGQHDPPDIVRLASYAESMRSVEGRATVYVCQDFACHRPVFDLQAVRSLLNDEDKP